MIHTDTLNESGFVEDTIAAFKGRTIHAFHTEGAGGGHAPDIIKVAGLANVLPVLDQSDAALHGQHARRASRHADGLPSPRSVDPGGRRLRRKPHPQGDHRGRGHPARPRRALDHLLRQPGDGPGRRGDHPHLADRAQDEGAARRAARRQRAATTISASSATSPNTRSTRPSRTGIDAHVGSVEAGKLADLVLWSPAFFGVKPDLVIKGGTIAAAPMGDPNASIPTPQPVHYRPMFGAFGRALTASAASPSSARRRWTRGIGERSASTSRSLPVREHARRHRQGVDDPQRRDAEDRGRSGDLRGAGRRRAADLRAGRRCCRWRSAISCSECRVRSWPASCRAWKQCRSACTATSVGHRPACCRFRRSCAIEDRRRRRGTVTRRQASSCCSTCRRRRALARWRRAGAGGWPRGRDRAREAEPLLEIQARDAAAAGAPRLASRQPASAERDRPTWLRIRATM